MKEKGEMTQLEDDQLQDLYAWVDEIPLSRPKKSMTRDFSDGVLVAEVVHHFVPRIVELHNYTPANSTIQKQSNWGTLNRKVLSKLNYNVPESIVRGITNNKQGVVEFFLWKLKDKLESYLDRKKGASSKGKTIGKVREHVKIEDNKTKEVGIQCILLDHHHTTSTIGRVLSGAGSGITYSQMSPDGYLNGQEVGSIVHQQEKPPRIPMGRPPAKAQPGPKVPIVHSTSNSNLHKTRSLNKLNELGTEGRMLLEEKEQALLASNETVQILQAKVRRLEHLLQLKDFRIEELGTRLEQMAAKLEGRK